MSTPSLITSLSCVILVDPARALPLLQIKATMEKMTETLGTKQKEANEFAAKHKINTTGGGPTASAAPADDEGGSQGVLI